ncbi:MAG: hypothetical protein MJZ24_09105 [Paludibacteraceae bacterium]|nr:hypothetical protein [Paludibacteraceae bacterium]
MNEELTNLLANGKKRLEEFLPKMKEWFEPAIDAGKKVEKTVKEEYLPLLENFIKNVIGSQNIDCKEVQTLNMDDLLKAAKANIVEGANSIVAYKMQKDNDLFVYLANCKDDELIEDEKNKYVMFKCTALSADVLALFLDSDIVILN